MELRFGLVEILVVDDDEEFLTLLNDVLRTEGYRVQTATDGAQALELLAKRKFDLVIADKNLPLASGLDLITAAVKSEPKTQVIMITAFGDPKSFTLARERGAYECLSKPIKMAELKHIVKKAIADK